MFEHYCDYQFVAIMAEQPRGVNVLAKGVLLALVISVCWLYVNVNVHKVFECSVCCFGKVAPSCVGQRGTSSAGCQCGYVG